MGFDISKNPFSTYGSYMAVSKLPANYRWQKNTEGVFLRTVRSEACLGPTKSTLVAKLIPTADSVELPYEIEASYTELVLKTSAGSLSLCFADASTILVKADHPEMGLTIEFSPAEPFFDYIYEIPCEDHLRYEAICFGQNVQYLFWAQSGTSSMSQIWNGCTADHNKLHFSGNGEEMLVVIREIASEWDGARQEYDYDQRKKKADREFENYCRTIGRIPEAEKETAAWAYYTNYSSTVGKSGFLKRDAVYMSKNWMCSTWSWDHCFNAIALAYQNPEAAWDQWMLPFDYQDASGKIPDNVNNSKVDWNYGKPPVHGWTLRMMMQVMELSEEQLAEAYNRLSSWTLWWLNYRDTDHDGLCEYIHGYDSGWDNATAFAQMPPVESPDLTAYLIIQMDVLAELAEKLGRGSEIKIWKDRSEAMLSAMLRLQFEDDLPVAIHVGTHEIVRQECLLPYICILLGEKLPLKIREKMLAVLKSDRFLTKYGFATESPASSLYEPDGYWRGPIWPPSTLQMVEGIESCGDSSFAREIAGRYCRMAGKSGFAENFDALTGKDLRDPAYTWASSVYLTLVYRYLSEEA
ncbi:MAG: glycogen debranching protein [Eubacteriales bacterium]|nr:glycogen debranching protein [Eubacteriales bacterium]